MAIFTITGDTGAEIGGAATDDRYVFHPALIQPNQHVTITDAEGANTIQLIQGLEIASSSVTANAMQLTLNNGAVITILGADDFSFQTGGDGVSGAGGTVQSFSDFVTTVLGLETIPTGNTLVQGGPVYVVEQWTNDTQAGWIDDNTYISGTPDSYRLKIHVHDNPSQVLLDGIASAAEKVSEIVVQGGMTVDVSFKELVGYWGIAWVLEAHPDTQLPSWGKIDLDTSASQSITAERFEDLVFHELLHCLGFGMLWENMGLVTDFNGDLRFNGPSATAYYNSEFGNIAANDPNSHLGVPIETDGASGTAGKHWDDTTFGEEVMTGYLNGANHVSNMTIAALYDMGYEVIV